MEAIILVGVVFVIILIAAMVGAKKGKALADEGKITQRQQSFWEYAETFTTTATYENVREAVKKTNFEDCKADVYPDFEGDKFILFKSGHGWNAALKYSGAQDDKHTFTFYFPAWNTQKYGMPYGMMEMNVIETAIEKLFLALDPGTMVTSKRLETKSKSKIL